MKRWILWFGLAAVFGAATPTFAAGLIVIDDPPPLMEPTLPPRVMPEPPLRPGPPIGRLPPDWRFPPPDRWWPAPPPPRRYAFAPLELTHHKADVTLKDQIASVNIEQEFLNPNPRPLEGTFLFPLPKGAHLRKFTLEIGGRPVDAELLSADQARQIYEDIVRKMKDPALMEYAGRDLIKVRVFPIEANGRKRITLAYTQVLKSDAGLVEFVYPLGTEKFSARPIPLVSLKLELETARPLKTIYSPSHTVEVKRHGDRRATVGFEAKAAQADRDFQLLFSPEAGDVGLSLLTYRTGKEDGYFLCLAAPGMATAEGRAVPKDVALVLDTSGSMAGAKLTQAKKALQFCVENLNADDRFEVLRFSTEVEPLFRQLAEVTPDRRRQAADFIQALKPIGGTAIDDALRHALGLRTGPSDRPFVVIFLTDGLPTVGTTDEDQIVAGVTRSAATTRVFCFGLGTDVNTHLLDRITEQTRASSQYVLPEEDIEVKVSNFYAKIKEPVLANVKVTFPDGVRVGQTYPTALPDLFRGEQLVLVGRYGGGGSGQLALEGTRDGKTARFAESVILPETGGEQDFIPRLWATRRIGFLLDEIRLHGENAELKEEVTELARQFGIVTPYTAYLIVEDEKQRQVPVSIQTLPGLQMDSAAREVARDTYLNFQRGRTGGAAVAGARYGLAFKSADAPAEALALGRQEARRGLAAGAAPAPASQRPTSVATPAVPSETMTALIAAEQESVFVGGRAFVRNGNQWVDSRVQKATGAAKVQVQFNSPEYFALAAREPQSAAWLALGPNIQFVLNGTLYEIHE